MAFQTRADLQNQAIGWLQRGYTSLGGGTVVQFPPSWMSSGECRLKKRRGEHAPVWPAARVPETHENAKGDQNRGHERLKSIPPIPSNRTTAPIINATNATYFCSKSCAITTGPRSYSVAEASIDESPPNQTPKTVRLGKPVYGSISRAFGITSRQCPPQQHPVSDCSLSCRATMRR